MRLQIAKPGEHVALVDWPLEARLDGWTIPGLHEVVGLHRHVVRIVESGDMTYVAKELPDNLAEREWRLLRELGDAGLPTAEVVGVVTERDIGMDGLLITRNIDYSLPYRVLLSGRGLHIPYLGERLLDALAGLLVRLHLAGFYWGDCSLSNTLFRRDAGALMAYIIDVETGERHPTLSDGQRRHDLTIAIENVAGDLEDLQVGGLLAEGIDPISTALAIEETYHKLWTELTGADEFDVDETFRIDHRLQRLHDLGFDAAELELYTTADGSKLRLIPRVVEHGFHGQRLKTLTGLETGENQARRLLNDISRYRAVIENQTLRKVPETVAAARWLDERFEPTIDGVPPDLVGKLEPAELYHQVLEHLWFMSETAGEDIGLGEAVTSYVRDVLTPLPSEQRGADTLWDGDDEWDAGRWTAEGWVTEEVEVIEKAEKREKSAKGEK
jgi:tRNA A-37 threonylcarbamoyl transferase component Bud32